MNSKEIVILDQGWTCDLFALIGPYIEWDKSYYHY